ncbi:MAG: FAD/NAD(P)-binding oxidoreductase [Desulfobacula sp. GWF2_41_7]|nr:MAG: FAD/NAD(P)-binding oxidoreductase [Desulfobacula sp. GWF2_41_7]
MKPGYHVIIVGSGVAGIAAADTLAGHGLDILIIDENPYAGGQMIRETCRLSHGFWKFNPGLLRSKGFTLARKITRNLKQIDLPKGVDCIHQAQVLGVFPDQGLLGHRLLVHTQASLSPKGTDHGQVLEVKAEYLVFATGARERYLPFKGWTLPGVMSLGGAQILMKSSGILPARNTLIAGTSPLQMALAADILKNKGSVTAILDENRLARKIRLLPLLGNQWPRAGEGAVQMLGLILGQVRFRQGVRVAEARGKEGLETVVTAELDRTGKILPGTEKIYPAKALAIGYGFCANIELPVQAGCDIEYHKDRGGWVVRADENLETSVRSVYAAGEITGIAGAGKSFIEGKLAALSILEKLRITNKSPESAQDLILRRTQQMGYAKFLNRLCEVPPSAFEAIPDETLICRCEEISMGELKKRIRQGFRTAGSLKKATRCGMGRCQGRICRPVMFDILLALTGRSPEQTGKSLSRAPVKNVSIKAFLQK